MLSRPAARLLRAQPSARVPALTRYISTPSSSSSSSSAATKKAGKPLHTSSSQHVAATNPANVEYAGIKGRNTMTPEAKERIRDHARRIQSSAVASDPAAAVRPAPAPHFQAPPHQNTAESPYAVSEEDPNIRDGYDHS